MSTEEKLAQELVAADQYLQHSNFDQAYKIYQQLLQKFQTPEIYNNAAICAYNLESQECLDLISKAIQLDPQNAWYVTQHAQFLATSDFDLADKLFNQAINLAEKYDTSKKNEQINIQQQSAILTQIKHCYATFLFNYGCLHARSSEKSEVNHAINLFKKSLEFDESLYKSTYNLACCYINLDDFEEGLKYLFKTLELHPIHSQAHFALSQYYQQQGNVILAENHLQKSLSSTGINQANAEYNYGVLEQKRNNHPKSLEHYNKCLSIDPSHFAACYNTASIYHRLKNYKDAIKYYNLALTINPEDDATKYLLASLASQNLTEQHSFEKKLISQAPLNYIEKLFDSYAENFDHELVVNLEYKTPNLLHTLLTDNIDQNRLSSLDILDLGCGTGLSGMVFRPLARNLTGVDLSSKMLERATHKNIYNKLIKSDLDLFLIKNSEKIQDTEDFNSIQYDLIILADVLVYYGNLKTLFINIVNNLKPNGFLLFSFELIHNEQPLIQDDFRLQITSRFAHSLQYIESILTATNMKSINFKIVNLRKQNHQDLPGAIYLASRIL